MPEYVSQVILEVNGQEVADIHAVTEKEIELRKEVKLMNKVGVFTLVPKYGLEVDYVVPKDAPEFDFENVANGTLTIDKENGVRNTYSEVYTLKVGDTKYGEDKEAHRIISMIAMKRVLQ